MKVNFVSCIMLYSMLVVVHLFSMNNCDDPQCEKAWLSAAHQLIEVVKNHEITKQLTASNGSESGQGEDSDETSQDDTDLHDCKFLYTAYCKYGKKNEVIGLTPQALLTYVWAHVDKEKIIESKRNAAAWLGLVLPEDRDFFKQKMFECALASKNKPTIKYLVKYEKAIVSTPSLSGEYPLHIACKGGGVDIVKFLIKYGALDIKNRADVQKKACWLLECYGHEDQVLNLFEQDAPGNGKTAKENKCSVQ